MKKNVNPLVALVVIAVALVAVYYLWFHVLTGKEMGYAGAPPKVPGAPTPHAPPPGAPTREMFGLPPLPKSSKPARSAQPKGPEAAKTSSPGAGQDQTGK